MRILSPEKKYLYYLIISQLHEDGYTQQAMQLEVSTLHSTGCVKSGDKLSRLFSSCIVSVNEATTFFNNHTATGGPGLQSGKKRQIASNIRAASLANLAKRRRSAATIDSPSQFQDSIKKCVKLVTNDLQKAVPGSSTGSSPKGTPNTSRSSKNDLKAPVSNNFLKGISLLNNRSVPAVQSYHGPQINSSPNDKTANWTAQSRVPSENVVRVSKNPSQETVIIDIEAPNTSGLQLTQPSTAPSGGGGVPPRPIMVRQANTAKSKQAAANFTRVSGPKPVLTVGQTSASQLKNLVSKISKKPMIAGMPKIGVKNSRKPSLEVVMVEDSAKTTPAAPSTRGRTAPALTLPSANPHPPITMGITPQPPPSTEISLNPVLSALGLQMSPKSSSSLPSQTMIVTSTPAQAPTPPVLVTLTSTPSTTTTLTTLTSPTKQPPPPNVVALPESPSRGEGGGGGGQATPTLATENIVIDTAPDPPPLVKSEGCDHGGRSGSGLYIPCVHCPDEKFRPPPPSSSSSNGERSGTPSSTAGGGGGAGETTTTEKSDQIVPNSFDKSAIMSISSDTEFPAEIFAEEEPAASGDSAAVEP